MSAYSDFCGRVAEVDKLLDLVAPGWSPERQSEKPTVDAALPVGVLARSSLVLLVSYFEGFLKDLTDESFDRILDENIPCSGLPAAIRGQGVMQHVKRLRVSNDAAEIWGAVTELARVGTVFNADGPIDPLLLPREEVKREVTSIEPQKINLLLRAFADDELNKGPMSKHGQRLRGLKQIRDNAVHGNEQDLPPLGFADVNDARALLLLCARDLQERMDDLLRKIIEKVST